MRIGSIKATLDSGA